MHYQNERSAILFLFNFVSFQWSETLSSNVIKLLIISFVTDGIPKKLSVAIIYKMHYLILEGRYVIFDAEGLRLLVELRMIDGRLIDVPEKLVDAFLLDQVLLTGSTDWHLGGVC